MIVGADIATQSLGALIADEDLEVRGEGSRHHAPVYPRPGRARQDPNLRDRAIGPAIADALEGAERNAGDVRGFGLAGRLDGSVPVDEDCRPLSSCLIRPDATTKAVYDEAYLACQEPFDSLRPMFEVRP